MVGASTLFAYLLGLPMGVLLRVTDRGGIMENHAFNSVFGWVVNILRSLPFIKGQGECRGKQFCDMFHLEYLFSK